ncbi:MAG: DUF6090 family protein, partial [Psychroflexus sp.]|nr:DUF6090 family protein [Psychroflexus sp.]
MKKTWAQNIKKFLFEVIIVTLGILVAFNINKWDEKNKQQTEEIEAYKSLKDDLNTDLYVLNYYKRFHKDAKSYLKPILENNFEHVDSLGAYLKVAFDLQEGNPTYVNLKYSGKFGILKNPEIKSKVVLYYETYYQGLENISEIHSNLIYNKIDPYLIENFKFNMTSDDLQNSLKEDEFLNLI